jgi:hypothetical protein
MLGASLETGDEMRKLLAVVLFACIGAATWWLLRDEAVASPPVTAVPPAPEPAAPPVVATAPPAANARDAAATPAADAAPAVERTAVATRDATRPECTVRGRAVDADGRPLAGVNASLTGWGANSQRTAAWARDNPEPERIDLKLLTGDDGVFAFRCWPPPPFQFSLRLQGAGVATWGQRWSELAPGSTTDLGDVKVERGTLLRGRVVDAAGAPVSSVEVRIEGKVRTANGPVRFAGARTGDDGAFATSWALAAGEYTLGIDNQIIERPEKVTLAGEPELVIDVVLKRIDPADSISGVVVDDAGAPVRGVTVMPQLAGSGRIISTDAEGRFRVLRRDGATAEVALRVMARGYEVPPQLVTAKWGTHDVRIVLARGKELVVFVVCAADEQPVEQYVLRVIPTGGGISSSADSEPRGKPPHAGGRETVRGIRTGKHRVIVEPQGAELAIGVVPIEVGANGTPPVTVRLAAATPRAVHVLRGDSSPVAGTRVQLVDPLGEPWDEKVPVLPSSSGYFTTGPQALELAAAVTDAQGSCTLPVPSDRPLALMLPGPGHVPFALPQVVFPADGPLVVTVSGGAVLRGTIGPAAAWAEIQRMGGFGGGEASPNMLPSIVLHRTNAREQFPDHRSRCAAKPDGSFELTGIPPGRWSVQVSCYQQQAGGFGGAGVEEPAGTVDLVDGQTTTVALDLSAVLKGELEAFVLHNGAPLVDANVMFERADAGRSTSQTAVTGTDGRLRVPLRGGEHRLVWNRQNGSEWTRIVAAETAAVIVGQASRQTFTIASGTLKVHLVDATGAAVANVRIMLQDAGAAQGASLPATDTGGCTALTFTPGTYSATVVPKRLQDQNALMEFYRTARDPKAFERVRVQLGVLTVPAAGTSDVELKLPADW